MNLNRMNIKYILVGLCLTFSFYSTKADSLSTRNHSNESPDAQAYINQLIRSGKSATAIWSFSVRVQSGEEIINFQSSKLITPASNLKLVSTAFFLNELGEDFRFKTQVLGEGNLVDSVWNGDVIFYGSGDPSIGGEFYNDSKWFVFDSFLAQLKTKGIKQINGNLIGNESIFDDELIPPTWNYDDLSYYYAPEISALSFNRNCIDLVVDASGKVGSVPKISWFPLNTNYVTFINQQKIAPKNTRYKEYYHRPSGINQITLRSSLPQFYEEDESLSISNPALFFVDTFKKYAASQGFTISGDVKTTREKPSKESQVLAEHISKPLSAFCNRINKESDNFYAEMLYKATSYHKNKTLGTTADAVQLAKIFANEIRLDTTNMNLVDGSGMGTANLITTKDFTRLLIQSQKKSWFPTYYDSFSISGIDGSFKNRFKNTELEANLRGKSGYISGARTITGFLTSKKGNRLAFSIATNHFTERVRGIDAKHQQFLIWLYQNY